MSTYCCYKIVNICQVYFFLLFSWFSAHPQRQLNPQTIHNKFDGAFISHRSCAEINFDKSTASPMLCQILSVIWMKTDFNISIKKIEDEQKCLLSKYCVRCNHFDVVQDGIVPSLIHHI